MTRFHRFLWFLGFAALVAAPLGAHEIPRDVVVHAFVKPEGTRASILLRLPVIALRDLQLPETPGGNLDVARAQQLLRDGIVQWILPSLELRENGAAAGAPQIRGFRVASPSDQSFKTFEGALASATRAGAEDPRVPAGQAVIDVLLEYPIASDRSAFAIRPGFERLGLSVLTSLRYVLPGGEIRAFELRGDPGVVDLDPRWHQAGWRFVKLGFTHILDGTDHLLFLFCLVIPFRRLRPLVMIVTGFTAAHSVALVAAALGFTPGALWFPPLIETLIAASVLYMAVENVLTEGAPRRRAVLAFAFGLLHGFGFSFALQDTMQFAGAHLAASLFAFNLGVELGQIAVLLVLVPALALLLRYTRERMTVIVLSLLAAHIAWHWMEERWSAFRQFPLGMPEASTMVIGLRVMIAVMVVAGVARLVMRLRARGTATVVLLLLFAAPSFAQTRDELWQRCKPTDDLDLAIGACTALIQSGAETDRNLSILFMHRGNAYSRKNEIDRALKEYEVALKLDAANGKAYYNRGAALLGRDDIDGAWQDAEKALAVTPGYGAPYILRGEVYRRRGRYAEAVAEFDRALATSLDDPRVERYARDQRGRAQQATRCGGAERDLSIGACTGIIDDKSIGAISRAVAYNVRGVAHGNNDNYEQSVHDYTEALRLQPNNAVYHANRGVANLWTGRYESAAQDLDRSLALEPGRMQTVNIQGLLARQQGLYERALERFTTAISRSPLPHNATTATYINNRAITYLLMERYDEAMADVETALRLDPKHPFGLYTRGALRHRKGDTAAGDADIAAAKALQSDIEAAMAKRNVKIVR